MKSGARAVRILTLLTLACGRSSLDPFPAVGILPAGVSGFQGQLVWTDEFGYSLSCGGITDILAERAEPQCEGCDFAFTLQTTGHPDEDWCDPAPMASWMTDEDTTMGIVQHYVTPDEGLCLINCYDPRPRNEWLLGYSQAFTDLGPEGETTTWQDLGGPTYVYGSFTGEVREGFWDAWVGGMAPWQPPSDWWARCTDTVSASEEVPALAGPGSDEDFTAENQLDVWTVEVKAGDQVAVGASPVGGTGGITDVVLVNPDGCVVGESWSDGCVDLGRDCRALQWVALTDGTARVGVQNQDGEGYSYKILAEVNHVPVTPKLLGDDAVGESPALDGWAYGEASFGWTYE